MDTTAFIPTRPRYQHANHFAQFLDELKKSGDTTFISLDNCIVNITNIYHLARVRGFRVSTTDGTLAGVDGYLVTRK